MNVNDGNLILHAWSLKLCHQLWLFYSLQGSLTTLEWDFITQALIENMMLDYILRSFFTLTLLNNYCFTLCLLCVLYQILHQTCHINHPPLLFCTLSVNVRNRNPFLLSRPTCHTQAYDYSFFPHSIKLWNNLSESVLSSSLYSFKCCLSQYHSFM